MLLVAAATEDLKFLENQGEKTEEAQKFKEAMQNPDLLKGFEDILSHVRNPWKGRSVPSFECVESEGIDCLPRIKSLHEAVNRPLPPAETTANP